MPSRRTTRKAATYGEQGLRLVPLFRFKATASRYWRLKTFSVAGTFLEISEVQFHSGGVRQTGTMTASNTPDGGSVVSALNDNNLSTRAYWPNATAVGAGFWIKIDLSSPIIIDGIRLGGFDTSNRYPSAFTLERSSDDSTWSPAATFSGLAYPGNNTLSALLTV